MMPNQETRAGESPTYVVTAGEGYLTLALEELRGIDPALRQIMEPSQTVAVVEASLPMRRLFEMMQATPPIFVHHLAPAQGRVILSGDGNDLGELARQTISLAGVRALKPEHTFSVQARIVEEPEREPPYSSYAIKAAVAPLVHVETGATEDVRRPQFVISILAAPPIGFTGISPVQFNVSDWPGGVRRFEPSAASGGAQALIEALELFRVQPPRDGRALDLGAAPGHWSRQLRRQGLSVDAVDRQPFDEALQSDPRVRIIPQDLAAWLDEARQMGRSYHLVAASLPLAAEQAPRLARRVSPLLAPQGVLLANLRLPNHGNPIPALQEVLAQIRPHYAQVRIRHLFNSRPGEVLLYARRA